MKFNTLLFGTAGIPISTNPRDTINGIKQVNELKLGGMELEFVHSVNIKEDKTQEVKKTAIDNNVILTCHGQYYINLNSLEKAKLEASKQRICNAGKIADMCGGYSLVFHAGFYQQQTKEQTYETIKKAMKEIIKKFQDQGIKIWIRPETTGKPKQWGTTEEIVQLSKEIEQVMPCIDFSHLHARTNGKYNTTEEFKEILDLLEKELGRTALENMHIHLSGIEYTEKGEKNHLILKESDLNYKELLKTWKEYKIKGIVICESPNIEQDALLLQKTYNSI